MRDRLEKIALQRLPNWQQNSPRLSKLALWDMYLDATIYDCLRNEFDEDSIPGRSTPRYIQMKERKPSVKSGLAGTTASNLARKLFAGRHAPSLVLKDGAESNDAIQKLQDLLTEAQVGSQMIWLVRRGSVGSVCATYKIVEIEGEEPQLVMDVHHAVDCFPVFDAAKQLSRLRIAYATAGQWFIDNEVTTDLKGEPVKPTELYWYIRDLDKISETHYVPVPTAAWNPIEGFPESAEIKNLRPIEEGPLAVVQHELGYTPAQWFVNMTDGRFPDGGCIFEPGLDNIVVYDYGMSQLDLGVKNAACPITVLKGNLVQQLDGDNKPIPRSPTRYLQFEPTTKDGDMVEEGGSAEYLETTGQGFKMGLEFYRQIKKDATEQISASRKDPDKVTTAMSGKGLELVEEENIDLAFDFRTSFGAAYLKMIIKMGRAAIKKNHPLMDGVTEDEVKQVKLAWPDMHDLSPQEFQAFAQGLVAEQEAGVISPAQAQELHRTKVDVPISHLEGPKVASTPETIMEAELALAKASKPAPPVKPKAKPKAK